MTFNLKRKVLAFILVFFIAAVSFLSLDIKPAGAASITLESSVKIDFPNSITFNVKAQSEANVTQLRLHYIVNQQNFAQVISEGWTEFSPSPKVETRWVWNMRKSSLPVGAEIQYWWTAVDAQGGKAETRPTTITFDDTRFNWKSISEPPIILYWHDGDLGFARKLMSAAQNGLQRIQQDTGASPLGTVRVYIYSNTQELQSAQLFAQEWMGGATYSNYSIIALGVSPNRIDFGLRALPHEITHWVVGQLTFNNYGAGLPVWLEEGLATYSEGNLTSDYKEALTQAIKDNSLLSVRTLSSPFSAIPSEAAKSYGESDSIVTFLINTYGKEKMNQLLQIFREGSTYDEALLKVYGFDQDGLDKLWKESLGIKTNLPVEPVEAK